MDAERDNNIINVKDICPNGISNTRSDTYLNCSRSVCIDYFKVRFNRVFSIDSKEFKKLLTLLYIKEDFVTYENSQWDGYKNCFTLGSDVQYMYGGLFTQSEGNETSILQLKGSACRSLDDRFIQNNIDIYDGWKNLMEFCNSLGCFYKRIDTPLDYYGNDVNFNNLLDKIYKNLYVSNFKKSPEIIKSNGFSITFGKYSARTLCIYDKLQERKFKDYEVSLNNWMRFEPRFKDENADDYANKLLVALIKKDLGSLVCGVIRGLLDIKEKNNFDKNNLYKASTWSKWLVLLENNYPISITRYVNRTSTILKKYNWFQRSVSKAKMMIEMAFPFECDELLGMSYYSHIDKIKPKDIALINEDRVKFGYPVLSFKEGIDLANELYSKYNKVDYKTLLISNTIDEYGNVNYTSIKDKSRVNEIVVNSLNLIGKDNGNL